MRASAKVSALTATGYQMVVNGGESKALKDPKLVNLHVRWGTRKRIVAGVASYPPARTAQHTCTHGGGLSIDAARRGWRRGLPTDRAAPSPS